MVWKPTIFTKLHLHNAYHLVSDTWGWWMEDHLQRLLRAFWVSAYAIRPNQCSCSLPVTPEWCVERLIRQSCLCLSGWYWNLFSFSGRPCEPCLWCADQAAGEQVIWKNREVGVSHPLGVFLGMLWRKASSVQGVAHSHVQKTPPKILRVCKFLPPVHSELQAGCFSTHSTILQ